MVRNLASSVPLIFKNRNAGINWGIIRECSIAPTERSSVTLEQNAIGSTAKEFGEKTHLSFTQSASDRPIAIFTPID
ncbi:hypothetical protein [Chamaesiphon sp. GL140_3_metabinner_50]|uniref:hypothetical protein n=1 Tax=Chamaesiphon sp. GL140_3_metabinner_50 TaxID=2970812 RepID=UPI0025DC24A7|nr:hypothetical protein [Chamaesiphon sp. GL140_3_metabinner_50]